MKDRSSYPDKPDSGLVCWIGCGPFEVLSLKHWALDKKHDRTENTRIDIYTQIVLHIRVGYS
jgi:hypothetical protein